jgi:hypothetical protein
MSKNKRPRIKAKIIVTTGKLVCSTNPARYFRAKWFDVNVLYNPLNYKTMSVIVNYDN